MHKRVQRKKTTIIGLLLTFHGVTIAISRYKITLPSLLFSLLYKFELIPPRFQACFCWRWWAITSNRLHGGGMMIMMSGSGGGVNHFGQFL